MYMKIFILNNFKTKKLIFTGFPSELFYRGSGMWETLYGMTLAFPLVLYFFLPVYFNLGITSVYQVRKCEF